MLRNSLTLKTRTHDSGSPSHAVRGEHGEMRGPFANDCNRLALPGAQLRLLG